ncbi:sugar transferase, partial [Isoptericola sp. NPDC060257]|uniref:alpha/beta fold hydrolase n=1 Tax=Isoptericola sp. NPDC060257 TaxID=3347087 RepID=UPI003648C502
MRWERLGDPAAPPVVLCHGTPFSSYVWRRIARELALAVRVTSRGPVLFRQDRVGRDGHTFEMLKFR